MLLFQVLAAIFVAMAPARAQTNFRPGYVVTHEGDTLRGTIDDQAWVRSPKAVRFQRLGAARAEAVSVDDIRAFAVAGRRFARKNVRVDETPIRARGEFRNRTSSRRDTIFAEVLVDGPLSLYEYVDDRLHLYVEQDGAGIEELIYHQYLRDVEGRGLVYATVDRTAEQLQRRTLACPEVAKKAARVAYRRPQVQRVVVAYNACVGPESVRFVQASERRRVRMGIGAFAGVARSSFASSYRYRTTVYPASSAPLLGLRLSLLRPGGYRRQSLDLRLAWSAASLESHEPLLIRVRHAQACFNCPFVEIGRDYARATQIEVSVAKLAAGYTYRFRTGRVRPYAQAGAAIIRLMRYKATAADEEDRRIVLHENQSLKYHRLDAGLEAAVGVEYGRFWASLRTEKFLRGTWPVNWTGAVGGALLMGVRLR